MLQRNGTWYWTLSACSGSGTTCSTLLELQLPGDEPNQKLTLSLLADGQGKVTCGVKQGTTCSVQGDVSGYRTGQILGVALITFGAKARFDRAQACE